MGVLKEIRLKCEEWKAYQMKMESAGFEDLAALMEAQLVGLEAAIKIIKDHHKTKTDTDRLDWLIETGNYGYLDTNMWPGNQEEVRSRIDKAMAAQLE